MSGMSKEEGKIAVFKEVLSTYFRKLKDGDSYDFYLFPTPLVVGEKILEYAEAIQVMASLGKSFVFSDYSSINMAATIPKNIFAQELCNFAIRNKMVRKDDNRDIFDKNISVVVPFKELKQIYIQNTGNKNYFEVSDIASISVEKLELQSACFPFDVRVDNTGNYDEKIFSCLDAILWFKKNFEGNEVYLKTAKYLSNDPRNSMGIIRFIGDWMRFVSIDENVAVGYKFLYFGNELLLVKKATGCVGMSDWMLNYL